MAHSRRARGRAKSAPKEASAQGSSQSRSQRQLRVGEELRHALSQLLARGGLRDPQLAEANLTVTEVRVSPDLKNATAFVVPLGGGDPEPVVAALNHAAGFLRSQLGQEVQLRHTPRLSFQADHTFDEAARISAILHHPRVAQDVASGDVAAEDEDAEGGADRDSEDGSDGR
jgi:ribosome-binding factor A